MLHRKFTVLLLATLPTGLIYRAVLGLFSSQQSCSIAPTLCAYLAAMQALSEVIQNPFLAYHSSERPCYLFGLPRCTVGRHSP